MTNRIVLNGKTYGGGVDSVNGKTDAVVLTAADVGALPTSQKGVAGGVAALDATGKVPSAQLPSFVDDVLEFANLAAFPATGESGKIYIAQDTNLTYRWSGSAYSIISETIALGETSATAYPGDRGKAAYEHSQLTSGNPHNTTKAEVGLGNVNNTSDANKPISAATQTALNAKQATLNRTVGGNDNATGTIPDTGGNLSVPIPVTTVAPAASATQTGAGTRTLRAQIKLLVDNIAHLFANKQNNLDRNVSIDSTASGTNTVADTGGALTAKIGNITTDPIQGSVDTPVSTSWTSSLQVHLTRLYGQIYETIGEVVPITRGGTGVMSLAAAKELYGISNVDNTSDANKPISAATQTALNGKVASTTVVSIEAVSELPSTPAANVIYLVG